MDKAKPLASEVMTLRDYFAGHALQGIMSDPGMRPTSVDEFDHLAKRLFQVADAVMKARGDP